MAHRIYVYNIDGKTNSCFPNYLGEWNYEIPPLLLPLFSANIRVKGKLIYTDKKEGVRKLKRFYDLLGKTYQLTSKKAFYEPVNLMFEFLENLPYDTFKIDGTDVFYMNEEHPTHQAKEWAFQIQEQLKQFDNALASSSLQPLYDYIQYFGYNSFLEALETDWINYGLGYWNENAHENHTIQIFTAKGLKGIKDAKNKIIVSPIYEEIFVFYHDIAVAKKDDKFGYLKSSGVELVPTVYDDAFDAFKIFHGKIIDPNYQETNIVGIIGKENAYGLINLETNTILIPLAYEKLEYLFANYFNVYRDGYYSLINHENALIINYQSEQPFEFDDHELFFTSIKGDFKRKYFNDIGTYLGEYFEDTIVVLKFKHYYVKQNKFQKKLLLLKPDATALETEVDQIISLDNYEIIAFKKNDNWLLYNLIEQKYIAVSYQIININIESFSLKFPNTFILKTDNGLGYFDANQQIWLIPVDQNIKKITIVYAELFIIQYQNDYKFWHPETKVMSDSFDYISEPIDIANHKLIFYKNDTIYALTFDNQVTKITDEEIGALYLNRDNLGGKDSQFFNSFYQKWKIRLGAEYYKYYDNDSLYSLVQELIIEEKINDALPILRLGVERSDSNMMYELANIYAEENNSKLFNLEKAFELHKKASLLNHPLSWNNLGYHLQNGFGCKQDIEKAMQAYKEAGELGNGLGWANLGDLYYFGQWVDQDYDKALSYYLKAQKQDYFNDDKLAEIYYSKGEFNNVLPILEKDDDELFSPIYYAIMYENGYGIEENLKKSIKYYEKSLRIAIYEHAIQRLLFHYRKGSNLANEKRFHELLDLAKDNNIEIDFKALEIASPNKNQ